MSDKNFKAIRKQIRQICLEYLPTIIEVEIQNVLFKNLEDKMNAKLVEIVKNIKDTLDKVDENSKNLQSYIIRQTGILNNTQLPITENKKK